MEEKDPIILSFREELKALYEELIPLEKRNPEIYASIIQELREKVKDVRLRMARYKTELIMESKEKGGR